MGVKEYSLPDTLERVTPIGGKLVFEVYEDADGKQFCKISLMYQTTEQIRNMEQLSLENPPAKYELEFEGIEANMSMLRMRCWHRRHDDAGIKKDGIRPVFLLAHYSAAASSSV